MDSKEIRKINLRKLIKASGKKSAKFAEEVDTAPAYISQIFSAKTKAEVGDEFARKIERKLNLPRGWMDTLDHRDRQSTIEGGQLLEDYRALPDGLKAHIARKASRLRAYADALPAFIRDALRPPPEPERYADWEREVETDMHVRLNSKKSP